MSAVDADIWMLTETHQSVSPGAEFNSVVSSEPDRTSEPGERWIGIWSRCSLEPLRSHVEDDSRCAAARLNHPELGAVVVYGCVLPWGGSQWRGIQSAGGAAFAAALEMQLSDWKRLRADFPDALLVVAGDFNQDLADFHYYGSKRNRSLLEAALAEIGLVPLTAGAGDPIARGSAPYACIDHICITHRADLCVKSSVRWPEADKPDLRLSDHFGVAVELWRS